MSEKTMWASYTTESGIKVQAEVTIKDNKVTLELYEDDKCLETVTEYLEG